MAGVDTELLASVAELDPGIRARVLRLAHKALDKAEFLMEHGDPKTQQMVIREYLKIFSKHIETKRANDEIEVLREALEQLRVAVLTRTPMGELPETVEDIGDEAMEAVLIDGPNIPRRLER